MERTNALQQWASLSGLYAEGGFMRRACNIWVRWGCLGWLIGMTFDGFGAEITSHPIAFKEDSVVALTLSYSDTNRLLVTGDKIQAVQCPPELCTFSSHEKDSSGAVLLRLHTQQPFTLYLDTEKGHHVGLHVTPDSVSGRVIKLEPEEYGTGVLRQIPFETQEYIVWITKWMQSMMHYGKEQPMDIGNPSKEEMIPLQRKMITNAKKIVQYRHGKKTAIVQRTVAIYTGELAWRGYQMEVCNRGKQKMILNEYDFYTPSVKSVGLVQAVLRPGQCDSVYLIVDV